MHKQSPSSIVEENAFWWSEIHASICEKLPESLRCNRGCGPSHTGNTPAALNPAPCTALPSQRSLPADIRSHLHPRHRYVAVALLATAALASSLKITNGNSDHTFQALRENIRVDFDYPSEKRN